MKTTLMCLLLPSFLGTATVSAAQVTYAETPAPSPSTAEPTSVETAQLLFDRAMELMAAGKYARACRFLEESLRLEPAMGTQYRLAECYEQTDRLALAWSTFTAVARAAKERGNADREERASERAAALGSRIGKVSITIPASLSEIPALEISFDDHVIRPGRWIGGAHLIEAAEPGHHLLKATAPGKIPWRHRIVVKAGTMAGITVPKLESKQPPAFLRSAPGIGARTNRVLLLAGSAASFAGISAGAGLVVAAQAVARKRDDGIRRLEADPHLPPSAHVCAVGTSAANDCNQIMRWHSQAQWFRTAAIASFVVGGASAAGTMIALWSPKRRAPGRVEVSVGVGSVGLKGTF